MATNTTEALGARVPWWGRAFAVAAVAGVLAGCPGEDTPADAGAMDVPGDTTPPADGGDVPPPMDTGGGDVPPTPDAGPSTRPTMVTRLAAGPSFSQPVDAVPTASGATVYFVATSDTGVASVLRAAGAGAPSVVVQGAPLNFPTGIAISGDDARLFIADPTADPTPMEAGDDAGQGALYSISAEGGTLATVPMSATIHRPRAVAVHGAPGAELLTVIGSTEMDAPAIFRLPAAGGAPTVLAMGAPLVDPAGLAVANDGTVYVLDARADSDTLGSVWRIPAAGGAPMAVYRRLHVAGHPAGLALSRDGQYLVVAGATQGGEDGPGLLTLVNANGEMPAAPMAFAPTMEGLGAPLGLHRARNADVFAVADQFANDAQGAVLVAR